MYTQLRIECKVWAYRERAYFDEPRCWSDDQTMRQTARLLEESGATGCAVVLKANGPEVVVQTASGEKRTLLPASCLGPASYAARVPE